MAAHDPSLLDIMFSYGIDVRKRRVFLHGDMTQTEDELGRNTPETVSRAILYLDQTPGPPIELWICTSGGDLGSMFGLYDVIRTRTNLIHTVAFGEVCSAGCLVLAAGDKRFATPNAWFMSHAESGHDGCPTVYDQADRTKVLLRMETRYSELMASRTKKSVRWWKEIHKTGPRELWLSAKQMVQYGVVDEILPETHT